jgi:hypothetical protein
MKDLGRRISIAPMMDWRDGRNSRWDLNNLRSREMACSSFVAAANTWTASLAHRFVEASSEQA